MNKLVMGIRCEGTEEKLWKCYHEEIRNIVCPRGELVAGVVCTDGEWRYFTVQLKQQFRVLYHPGYLITIVPLLFQ